jgi:hypothetical protein
MPGTEPAPGLEEFDLGYYGWHVVLAASLGVMAGFGSLFVCTFAVFVKPLGAEFGWNREAISASAESWIGWHSAACCSRGINETVKRCSGLCVQRAGHQYEGSGHLLRGNRLACHQ